MKLTLLLKPKINESWTLSKQVGVTHIISKLTTHLTGKNAPYELKALQEKSEEFTRHGLSLIGLEGDQFDMSRIKLGLPGRDEDLNRYRRMIRNASKVGISFFCYNFMAGIGWIRTATDVPERGDALTTQFRRADMSRITIPDITITEEQLWDNWKYFIRAILPTAQEYNIRLALHPDDPPISPLGSISRIFTSADSFRMAQAYCEGIIPESSRTVHRITFCQATFKAMGENLKVVATEFLKKKWIYFIHLRDIRGTKYDFTETFHDNGPTDMALMLKLYNDNGFDGMIRPDHTPAMTGEMHHIENSDTLSSGYGIKGKLFAIGYMRGILDGISAIS